MKCTSCQRLAMRPWGSGNICRPCQKQTTPLFGIACLFVCLLIAALAAIGLSDFGAML